LAGRIDKLVKSLKKSRLDYLLVTAPSHLRYLCGFSGSNGLGLISGTQRLFLTDFRYKDQVKEEVKGFQTQMADRELFTSLSGVKKLPKGKFRLGFEAKHLSYANYQKVKEVLPKAELVPTYNLVEELVAQKEPKELEKIRKAAEIVDEVFDEIVPQIKPGVSEMELAAEIEYRMKKKGASGSAFEPIVASGYRSALPHGRASNKKLKKGEFVTLDFGAVYDGYVSDLTRTVLLGHADAKQRKIYSIVYQAQRKGIAAIETGKAAKAVDQAAREFIKKKGFGPNFGHGLGHGIGVQVHESPILNPRSSDILKENMVVTIEPGIYISKWGGVRIEDDVLVTSNGPEVLTSCHNELLEL
jgi:Xaa-Pro aminopeptidase